MKGARLVGERKPVTALFADIVGSTSLAEVIDPEDWTTIINGAFHLMSQAVFAYEGTVAKLQGDAMICFFGAPVAHEDYPERAVRAALAMGRRSTATAGTCRPHTASTSASGSGSVPGSCSWAMSAATSASTTPPSATP